MVSLQDEVMIVDEVLESLAAKVDPVALFFPGRPVQLNACESFAEEPYHSDLAISYHVELTTDTVVGGISLEDRCGSVL